MVFSKTLPQAQKTSTKLHFPSGRVQIQFEYPRMYLQYIILLLRRVTPMLDPGLMIFGGLETWAAVGREFVFCQHCSGLTTQIIC
jgi:hypothetical protein